MPRTAQTLSSALRRRGGYDRLHRIRTGDGWPVALYEYEPKGTPRAAFPLLACHGAFSRYSIYDMGEGEGLAPYLAGRGWHIFAMDWRGRGQSLPRRTLHRLRVMIQRGWTFDDFLQHDLPGAIEAILKQTGAKQTDYIGHSMGGILGLFYLADTQDERVRRAIIVGAAGAFPRQFEDVLEGSGHFDLMKNLRPLFTNFPMIPFRPVSRLGALAPEPMLRAALKVGFNVENMDTETMRRYLWNGVSSVSSRKFFYLQKHVMQASPVAATERMARFRHPALLIAGGKDYLVPLEIVRQTYEMIGSGTKRLANFSRSDGYSLDYGHGDLLLGRNAKREIFPLIEEWLKEK